MRTEAGLVLLCLSHVHRGSAAALMQAAAAVDSSRLTFLGSRVPPCSLEVILWQEMTAELK